MKPIVPAGAAEAAKEANSAVRPMNNTPAELRSLPGYPVVLDPLQSPAAEYFGILRSRLLGVHSRRGIRSLIITSSEKGEGKTMVALNLALSLAQLGQKRILLVDGDLRVSTTSHLFKLEGATGLSNYLRGTATYGAIVHRTNFPTLSVVPAGTAPDGLVPQLLEGNRWAEFLQLAKIEFDLVIIDCLPATAPVADFELLLTPCDTFLLVVQLRRTTRQGLSRIAPRLDRSKCLGVLLNNSNELLDYSYYSYYQERKAKK